MYRKYFQYTVIETDLLGYLWAMDILKSDWIIAVHFVGDGDCSVCSCHIVILLRLLCVVVDVIL